MKALFPDAAGYTQEYHALAYLYGKKLSCEELPVLAILKEWREFSSIRGRNAHTGKQHNNRLS